ncbi:MAG: RIP metalloprotease RseP [SAR86 cluster bacterium]|uniref:Zinc metalloprotease n=1 Tax=SAR86 cluster bacterium TaxID=2030880 RepID=A0A937LE15_9GAMM|nr:RIP metalloprotease RseP [SAR86 cluster bacterium]
MTFLVYIFSFLALISIIVFIHELGHFSFARLFGVRVLDFSIGFGKSIKSWETKSKTIFNLRLLPFGGYVKMNGEEISDKSQSGDSYASKKYYQKLLITLGGPIFNFILAIVIFFTINLFGIYKIMPIVGDVLPNSIAYKQGIEKGDLISKIDGTKISSFSDAQLALSKRLGESGDLEIEILRNENSFEFYLSINNWLSSKEPSNLLYELGIFPPLEPIIGSVMEASPAAEGGIKPGDKILEISNKPITYWGDIRKEINKSKGNEILVKILRGNEINTLGIKPNLSENTFNWQIGVSSSYELSDKARVLEKYSLKDSLKNSISQTYSVIENSITFIIKIIFGQVSTKNLGGPVMIGQYAGESVIYGGFYSFFYLTALISISLGIVNLFPLPVLDGGQALILTIEKIIGRDIPVRILEFFYRLGTAFLIFLFVFVFFNDIFRILS